MSERKPAGSQLIKLVVTFTPPADFIYAYILAKSHTPKKGATQAMNIIKEIKNRHNNNYDRADRNLRYLENIANIKAAITGIATISLAFITNFLNFDIPSQITNLTYIATIFYGINALLTSKISRGWRQIYGTNDFK